jgi:AcrR family transcriptional regulator
VHDAVLALAAGKGCHGWDRDGVAAKANVAVATVRAHYDSNEDLLSDAVLSRASEFLEQLGAGAAGGGRTPRSRILKVVRALTESLTGDPLLGRDGLRAVISGGDGTATAAGVAAEQLQMALARAVAGSEPGDPEWAVAGVIQGVWLAAAVAWTLDPGPAEHIDDAVVRALRLMKVNG